ncbi:HD domain protein [Acididesulfobacillus acetoxydans]|uniref:HD domain protein n=1 Tax=Acididesulfobacillus acetoxydans TaxID=1561005 RepID=A0A8S0WQ97_9FIRM|nr:HD domain-containing protein [Acididesulfobacillus acetoxydans]CAA7602484.1 HD domain protein [Acididesulfobacillus acetoxydans]CEJ05939.1 HD domain-containing protein [Acididesulfobacillus acetoxydans]
MRGRSIFYRSGQFIDVLWARFGREDLSRARHFLPATAYALFLRQSPAERRHSLKVAAIIDNRGPALPPNERRTLLQAALLHDCGKSLFPLRLWQRVLVVCCQKSPQEVQTRLLRGPKVVSSPLRLAQLHPAWGSRLAHQAGLNDEVCRLIAEHHQPRTPLGRLLAEADDRC